MAHSVFMTEIGEQWELTSCRSASLRREKRGARGGIGGVGSYRVMADAVTTICVNCREPRRHSDRASHAILTGCMEYSNGHCHWGGGHPVQKAVSLSLRRTTPVQMTAGKLVPYEHWSAKNTAGTGGNHRQRHAYDLVTSPLSSRHNAKFNGW